MQINAFEGARRISLLLGALVTIGILAATATHDPYLSLRYNISAPNAPFVRTDDTCPTEAGSHYFSAQTKTGRSAGIDLCLLPMAFGEKSEQLVPYKIDQEGMIWGAATYSTEVSVHERELERRFVFPAADEAWVEKDISARYKRNWLESLGYLVAGLSIYWALISAVGWIVRGFAGIPRGKDRRPSGP